MCFKLIIYTEDEDGYKISTVIAAHKVVTQEDPPVQLIQNLTVRLVSIREGCRGHQSYLYLSVNC